MIEANAVASVAIAKGLEISNDVRVRSTFATRRTAGAVTTFSQTGHVDSTAETPATVVAGNITNSGVLQVGASGTASAKAVGIDLNAMDVTGTGMNSGSATNLSRSAYMSRLAIANRYQACGSLESPWVAAAKR